MHPISCLWIISFEKILNSQYKNLWLAVGDLWAPISSTVIWNSSLVEKFFNIITQTKLIGVSMGNIWQSSTMKENSVQDTHIFGEISTASGIWKVDSSTCTFPLFLFNNEIIDFNLDYSWKFRSEYYVLSELKIYFG